MVQVDGPNFAAALHGDHLRSVSAAGFESVTARAALNQASAARTAIPLEALSNAAAFTFEAFGTRSSALGERGSAKGERNRQR
jgi:hypothetical protein